MEKDTRFVNELNDLAREDGGGYLALAEQVEDLTHHSGWGVLTGLLEARERRVTQEMLGGDPLEQAEYARKAGEIDGLRQLRGAVATVAFVAEKVRREREKYQQNEAARQAAGVM